MTKKKTVSKKSTGSSSPDIKKILKKIKEILIEKKCENTVFLDLEKVNSYLSIFVITTVGSAVQAKAVSRELERSLKEFKLRKSNQTRSAETSTDNGWILLDLGEIIIHIMTPDKREFYSLDKLWGDAKAIKV
ncbi:MAG: ribosome silencing factor [Leptospiraceae bacterium]|nr:ribosome silencing factor [Leptospiraceae bacterium]MCP5511913.1 ribosome silencing factor [Leptospiraceae bacterium]